MVQDRGFMEWTSSAALPTRLTSGLDRTSLAASTDGRRLVGTLARSKRTLGPRVADSPAEVSAAT